MIILITVLLLGLSWQNNFMFLKELISAGLILLFVMIHAKVDQKGGKAMPTKRNQYTTSTSQNVVLTIVRNGNEDR